MTLPAAYIPTNEQVIVAWVKANTVLPNVATSLAVAPWPERLFVTIRDLNGGIADVDTDQRQPLLDFDYWAHPTVKTGAGADGKTVAPPWNLANQGAEILRKALRNDIQQFGQVVDLGANYLDANVESIWFVTEPRRIENDPNGYARYSNTVAAKWSVIWP